MADGDGVAKCSRVFQCLHARSVPVGLNQAVFTCRRVLLCMRGRRYGCASAFPAAMPAQSRTAAVFVVCCVTSCLWVSVCGCKACAEQVSTVAGVIAGSSVVLPVCAHCRPFQLNLNHPLLTRQVGAALVATKLPCHSTPLVRLPVGVQAPRRVPRA